MTSQQATAAPAALGSPASLCCRRAVSRQASSPQCSLRQWLEPATSTLTRSCRLVAKVSVFDSCSLWGRLLFSVGFSHILCGVSRTRESCFQVRIPLLSSGPCAPRSPPAASGQVGPHGVTVRVQPVERAARVVVTYATGNCRVGMR